MSPDPDLKLLKDLDPAAAILAANSEPPLETFDLIRADLQRQAEPVPARRRAPRLALGVAGSAAIALALAALPIGSDRPIASTGAIRVLENAARISAAGASESPQPSIYYSRVRGVGMVTTADDRPYSYLTPAVSEIWVRPDGSGRRRVTELPFEWPGPQDEQRWREQEGELFPGMYEQRTVGSDEFFGPGSLDGSTDGHLPPIRDLPTDPDELGAEIHEAAEVGGAPIAAQSFEIGTDLIIQTATSPELRSACYAVLADLEGVELLGAVTDSLGRTGTGVAMRSTYIGGPQTITLIFDESTATPLETTTELPMSDGWDGRVILAAVLEDSGPAETLRSRP